MDNCDNNLPLKEPLRLQGAFTSSKRWNSWEQLGEVPSMPTAQLEELA